MPKVVELLNEEYPGLDGNKSPRMEISAYNLDDEEGRNSFCDSSSGKMIKVPFSEKEVWYDPSKKIGITKDNTYQAYSYTALSYSKTVDAQGYP